MNASFIIGKAGVADAAAITQLINSAYRGGAESPGWTSEGQYMEGPRTMEAEMAQLLRREDTDCFKYCGTDGSIRGFVSLEPHERFVYLGLLTVAPEEQSGGIGRRLLDFSIDYALSQHIHTIIITVVNIRQELIAWYERRGYRITGKTYPFPAQAGKPKVPIHLIEMRKELISV